VLVHQPSRAGAVTHFDARGQFHMCVENAPRHARRQRGIVRRPGDVLQRDELDHQDAVVRCFGDGEMELARGTRKGGDIVDLALGFGDQ
jgi:hypothetical protein